MKKRYCHDCDQYADVYEETIVGAEYISCAECGNVIAEINFDWELPT